MIGSLGSSGGGSAHDLDSVLRILALVSNPVEAKATADELRGLLKDVADAQAASHDALVAAHGRYDEAQAAMVAAQTAAQVNAKRSAELDERTRTVEAAFARLATAQTEFTKARDLFESKSTAQQAGLTARADSISRCEIALRQSEQEVAAMKADLQVRLDRIRAAAA
jgi:chromosome segregation ATPase